MSAPTDDDPREQGVLANLPRTRPQRPSARRAAARQSSARQPASKSRVSAGTKAPERKPSRVDRANGRSARTAVRVLATEPSASQTRTAPPGSPSRPTRTRSGLSPTTRRTQKRAGAREPVPRQGFESESDRSSRPVQPPGAPELAASAAEIIGELAKSGLSTGERLLKDVLSRLPLS